MFINRSREETTDRLSILHILYSFNYPILKGSLIEFVNDNNIIHYFEIHELLLSLKNNQLIQMHIEDSKHFYEITENGKITLEFFKDRIPAYLQNNITYLVSKIKKPDDIKQEIRSYYEKINEENYEVFLELLENKKTIMKLSINVVSKKQVLQLIDKWNKDSDFLYGDIINLLTK